MEVKQNMSRIWKQRTAEAKALAEPLSSTIARLKTSLTESNSQGLLSGCSVLFAARPDQTELLNRTCFGRPIITAEKDKQWFQLSLEEALYLSSILKCMKLVGENKSTKSDEELWCHMMSKYYNFPVMFKAYSHLRMKNWVVKSGSLYGVDFVAYRHHPSLVHAEYAVIVLSDEGESKNGRLNSWSDFHCTLRLCGGVVKTLLLLHVRRMNGDGRICVSSLDDYNVEERIVSRWNPEKSREGPTSTREGSL
ncbi:tRNA-splicing endonuclease subunit Sen2-1 [Striga hermonthica]|uniref:tRNA-intron lyase n=1 Tax=Striga hermonthica TaxID=68872 RepID=A0A9N7MP67_STRHE|nr:tRNA-splicing endonuclease subunit Sen2-1 [Striga hermonthica]